MSNRPVRTAMATSAVCFTAVGILLPFAPAEASAPPAQDTADHALHQLLGAGIEKRP